MRRRGRRIGTFVALAPLFLLAAVPARAELTERGDLFVKFDGGLTPQALPRNSRGPIAVSVGGIVRTLSGERPPTLREISIAINRGGIIDTRGLPRCRWGRIKATTSEQAMQACGAALVGHGYYDAAMAFPEQSNFPLHGKVLAFNAIVDGKRAILAHVFGTDPAPMTRIVVFYIERSQGTFGTTLTTYLSPTVNRYGYLKEISLNLHRTFLRGGEKRSYLSAKCAAPAGLAIGVFPFARVSMGFEDGRELSSTLIRSCRVKE